MCADQLDGCSNRCGVYFVFGCDDSADSNEDVTCLRDDTGIERALDLSLLQEWFDIFESPLRRLESNNVVSTGERDGQSESGRACAHDYHIGVLDLRQLFDSGLYAVRTKA